MRGPVRITAVAAIAMFAFVAVGTAVAQAEVAREPSLLLLENGVTKLEATYKGGAAGFATLGGKELIASGVGAVLKGCKNLATSEKDTTLCEATFDYTGWKEGKIACRSETQNEKEKDQVETVLVVFDVHLANVETSEKVLEPLLLFKVLGMKSGEAKEELVINCGGVKEKVRGVLPCLLLPGLVDIPITTEAEIKCVQNATTHDQVTGKCELLCDWLAEHPLEADFGPGFEDAGVNLTMKGKFTRDIFLDD